MTAIVLAGHGSSVSPETGGIVRRAADLLREMAVADEVTAAFWKESPGFAEVGDILQSDKIIVVPVFAARGYYVDVVLPRELAKGRKNAEYVITPPIGEHPRMADLIEEAAKRALSVSDGRIGTPVADAQGSPRKAVLIVGHGTSKHPGSRDTTFAIVERLRGRRIAAEVEAAFLDDEPNIAAAIKTCKSATLVVVPNFIARGGHVGEDVPEELEKAVGARSRPTVRLIYAPPAVSADEIAAMARDLAENA